jgi:serine/threonine protein kinase
MPLLRSLLLQIALGMQHLHANGIVHGELRLDNVMVSGQLPSTMALLQQQQEQQRQEQQQDRQQQQEPLPPQQHHHQQQHLQQQEQQRCGQPLGLHPEPQQPSMHAASEVAGWSGSQSLTGPNGGEAHHEAASSAAQHVSSTSSSGISGGGGLKGGGDNFTLKLKDIGLCTIGWSHRQVRGTSSVVVVVGFKLQGPGVLIRSRRSGVHSRRTMSVHHACSFLRFLSCNAYCPTPACIAYFKACHKMFV